MNPTPAQQFNFDNLDAGIRRIRREVKSLPHPDDVVARLAAMMPDDTEDARALRAAIAKSLHMNRELAEVVERLLCNVKELAGQPVVEFNPEQN